MVTKASNEVLNLTSPPIDAANLVQVAVYSATAHSVIIGQGTSNVTHASPGTIGQVLHSNGPTVDPSFQPIIFPNQRDFIIIDIDYYVNDGTGNDGNDGTTALTPWKTLQHAWNAIQPVLDLAGFRIVVHVADGTYNVATGSVLEADGAIVGQNKGAASVVFVGNSVTPANCVISATNGFGVTCLQAAALTLDGFKFIVGGNGIDNTGYAINSAAASSVMFKNIDFGVCGQAHINIATGAQANATGNYKISGGSKWHFRSHALGLISVNSVTVTLVGTPAFSIAFADADLLAAIESVGVTWSGSATGIRYIATGGGQISTQGAGATYFPGNVGGSSDRVDQYQ